MAVLVTAVIVFSIVALLFLRPIFSNLRHGRFIRATGSAAISASAAALAAAAVVIATSYVGYKRLTAEQSVAMIEFSRERDNEYTARLMLDGELDRVLPIRGDEWQLDARVLTWQPPATVLGLDPVYQLERLSGRYTDVERELIEPRTVHSLAKERPLDLWSLAREYPAWTPGVDAFYGTATYLPLADGARFSISLSRDALIARPINEPARQAIGDWGLKQE